MMMPGQLVLRRPSFPSGASNRPAARVFAAGLCVVRPRNLHPDISHTLKMCQVFFVWSLPTFPRRLGRCPITTLGLPMKRMSLPCSVGMAVPLDMADLVRATASPPVLPPANATITQARHTGTMSGVSGRGGGALSRRVCAGVDAPCAAAVVGSEGYYHF